MVILKAMGLESDQEIVQLVLVYFTYYCYWIVFKMILCLIKVGMEPELIDIFSASLEEPYNLGVFSKQQALAYIGQKVNSVRSSASAGAYKPSSFKKVSSTLIS